MVSTIVTIRLVLCHRHIRTVYFKRRTEIMAVYFLVEVFLFSFYLFPLGQRSKAKQTCLPLCDYFN